MIGITCSLAALAAATGVARADEPVGGTPRARYAASLVNPAQVQYVHSELLYTHLGDDRYWGPEHDLARDNIVMLLDAYGLSPYLHPFSYLGDTYYNVVSELPGTTRPDEIVIVGAHFDSYNASYDDTAPGADDNASGVATMLELARLVSQWGSETTIRFMAFDREEQGLIGSCAYAEEHASDNILRMLAIDMIAHRNLTHDDAFVFATDESSLIEAELADALRAYGGLHASLEGASRRSDHACFEDHGFQGARLAAFHFDSNPHYHSSTDAVDTPGNIDYPYFFAMVRSALGWLVEAAGVHVPVPAGDLNGDYVVDCTDINPFVLAMANPAAYAAAFPDGDILAADVNGDGSVDFADIAAFLELLGDCGAPAFVGRLDPPAADNQGLFGAAVAVESGQALVGSPGAVVDAIASGAVFVYGQESGPWPLVQTVTSADAAAYDSFGTALARDAGTLLVGATGDDEAGSSSGSTYAFEYSDGAWSQVQKLVASDGIASAYFGVSVDLDGDTAVIGASRDKLDGIQIGSAYVFVREGGTWVENAKLTPADGAVSDAFGTTVAVCGATIAVGAPQHAAAAGAVYVFAHDGAAWQFVDKLEPDDLDPGFNFGSALAMGADLLFVGAMNGTLIGRGPGRVYVYARDETGWQHIETLQPADSELNDHFGCDIALAGDLALIGAYRDLALRRGTAYLFQHTGGAWTQAARLSPWDGIPRDMFANRVATDGTHAILGARLADAGATFAGAAYLATLAGDGQPRLFAGPEDTTVAAGEPLALQVVADASVPLAYRWYRDGVLLVDSDTVHGARTAHLTVAPVAEEHAGVYEVVIRTHCGPPVRATAEVTVVAPAQGTPLTAPPVAPPALVAW